MTDRTPDRSGTQEPFRMDFDIYTIKHLGLQMYSTLPPVIGELVANAWDANAKRVEITIPEGPIDEHTSEITIVDDGIGMSDGDIRRKYLIIGRDRRQDEQADATPPPLRRRVMGRKGIGKFSALEDVGRIFTLFQEWEIVEAKEMSRVTEGRITAIEKLQGLIERNALEVPTLRNFLKEFPWVIDPRWTLVDDEVRYSKVLRQQFRDDREMPEIDRRIDFLCVRESTNLVVVEIKRPQKKVSEAELEQIERYVAFMRDHVKKTTDPEVSYQQVVGYLLCGDLVDTYMVRERRTNLERSRIFVRRYDDLLDMVKRVHGEFIQRYGELRKRKG